MNYRFYVLDKDDHLREPPKVFECPDDETAVETGCLSLNEQVIEVAGDFRRVAEWFARRGRAAVGRPKARLRE